MTKLKGKRVRCDVCQKTIMSDRFCVVTVFKVDYDDRYIQESWSGCEKDFDVCNDCIKNLNFGSVEEG